MKMSININKAPRDFSRGSFADGLIMFVSIYARNPNINSK